MTETVVALYERFEDAQRAILALQDDGFARDDIGLVARDTGQEIVMNPGVKRVTERRDVDQRDNVGKGVGIGGVVGGMVGLLAGLGSFAIPGFGVLIVAGPVLSALIVGGVGVATGGLIGALTSSGIPNEGARDYVEGVERGDTLVMVKTDASQVQQARNILGYYHPANVDEHVTDWNNTSWTGDADVTQPQVSDDDDGFVDDAERGTDAYRQAYQYGFHLLADRQYRGRTWEDIEIRVRQDWERDEPDMPWSQYKDAIHEGWDRANEP